MFVLFSHDIYLDLSNQKLSHLKDNSIGKSELEILGQLFTSLPNLQALDLSSLYKILYDLVTLFSSDNAIDDNALLVLLRTLSKLQNLKSLNLSSSSSKPVIQFLYTYQTTLSSEMVLQLWHNFNHTYLSHSQNSTSHVRLVQSCFPQPTFSSPRAHR